MDKTPERQELRIAAVLNYLGSTGFFLTFVYLALFLKERFALDAPAIGASIGLVTLISASFSWLGGMVADRFGVMKVLSFSFVAYFLATAWLALAPSLPIFLASIVALGSVRAVHTPTIKTLFVFADDGTGAAFRVRYIAMSLGFLSAGIFGRVFAGLDINYYFWVSSALYLLSAMIAWSNRGRFAPFPAKKAEEQAPIRHKNAPVAALLWIILYGFFLLMIISQFETTMPLYLVVAFGEEGKLVYRNVVMIGGVSSLGFAILVHMIRSRFPALRESWLVGLCTALSVISIWLYFSARESWLIYLATIAFVLAEVVLLPLMDAIATPLSHASNRARIMGILEIRQLAFFVGPIFGGWLLDHHMNMLPFALGMVASFFFPTYYNAKRSVKQSIKVENFARRS